MKCLTVMNPYPYLITLPKSDPRYKPVENRQRNFTYRGQMLIHAGKSHDWLNLSSDGTRDRDYNIPLTEMKFGVIWAVCNVVECFEIGRISKPADNINEALINLNTRIIPQHILDRWPEFATNPHVEGKYCMVLEDVRKFPNPIKYRGQQRLFDVPDEFVAEQLKAVGL